MAFHGAPYNIADQYLSQDVIDNLFQNFMSLFYKDCSQMDMGSWFGSLVWGIKTGYVSAIEHLQRQAAEQEAGYVAAMEDLKQQAAEQRASDLAAMQDQVAEQRASYFAAMEEAQQHSAGQQAQLLDLARQLEETHAGRRGSGYQPALAANEGLQKGLEEASRLRLALEIAQEEYQDLQKDCSDLKRLCEEQHVELSALRQKLLASGQGPKSVDETHRADLLSARERVGVLSAVANRNLLSVQDLMKLVPGGDSGQQPACWVQGLDTSVGQLLVHVDMQGPGSQPQLAELLPNLIVSKLADVAWGKVTGDCGHVVYRVCKEDAQAASLKARESSGL